MSLLRVAPYNIQLPVYSGPLDLLLQLIERQELDITRIALAQVTAQYLAEIRAMQAQNLDQIADFLVIAAKLLLIKSEVLLPRPPQRAPDEEDAGEELTRLLLEYRQLKQAATSLQEREELGLRSYVRTATPPRPALSLDDEGLQSQMLWQALAKLLKLLPPDAPPVANVIRRQRFTIRQKMQLLVERLRQAPRIRFFSVLEHASTRVEVIVTFLAVLELIKQRRVEAWQDDLFGDIEIEAVGDWLNAEELDLQSELDVEHSHLDETLKH